VRRLHRDEQVVVARIDIAWHGARFGFVTRNPKRRPQWMGITLEEGPFNRLEGQWQLTPLAEWGCRIDFSLSYDFASSLVGTLASPVFDRIANRLVDAFIHRADQTALAGGPPGP
jgi:ribosome-associated toxin RatA of RatAB toxin-antitoxin module